MTEQTTNETIIFDNPLVSIIVITYNSAKYVIETLESAKSQIYRNIELIVSDDCSQDNTVGICANWLEENKTFFVRTKLVTVSANTGISANCNRGVNAAKGEWIKLIAGDDTLNSECISIYIENAKKINNAEFFFSRINTITETGEQFNSKLKNSHFINTSFFDLKAVKQYDTLVRGGVFVPAVSSFLKKDVILKLKGFDEEIPMCEDYPMWLKATKNGVKLSFIDKVTCNYRIHNESIMQKPSIVYQKSMQKIFFKYRFSYLLRNNLFIAIELYFFNISRLSPFWSKVVPYLLPSNHIFFLKNKLSQ